MRNRKGPVLMIVLLLMTVMLAACGGAAQKADPDEVAVDPPSEVPPAVSTVTVPLYFADWQAQHLIPEVREVPQAEGAAMADQVVDELLKGPTDPHLNAAIPANVKKLEPVTVENEVAYVNLSQEFEQIQGAAGSQMAVGSLVQSLTDIAGITKVQVLVEGHKALMADPGMELEPMERGFYGDIPVLFDQERAEYLADRVEQGLDTWRTDPAQVVQWEGRMFGFTAAELQGAAVQTEGTAGTATLTRNGTTYTIRLAQQGKAWVITAIES